MLLVGVHKDDTESNATKLADRIAGLRIFNDPEGKMNLSLRDFPADPGSPCPFEYDVLAVSNFTVYGDAAKSRRPSFTASAPYELGEQLFNRFVQELRAQGIGVQTGTFGAHMLVSLINDGPVTLTVEG
jgi:D-tyrosyl-tRNA(Tyr) deacylase